jgi:putative ABC transport system substrate-binding protein
MRRREFITLLGGAAAWPVAGRTQQTDRMRHIGVLMSTAADDPESRARVRALLQGLQELGWIDGRNIRLEYRWGEGLTDRIRDYAVELVALAPDVIVANGSPAMGPLQRTTTSLPIVFVNVIDPVGAGYVASLARPGGNATGFTLFEYGISAKWLELLKEIAPHVRRVAVMRDPTQTSGIGQFAGIQAMAPSFRVELTPVNVRDAGEIEREITTFARESNGGLIVTGNVGALVHRDAIIALAARHRIPAVYAFRYHVTSGGLISYGPDTVNPYRRSAAYVDRIFKGEKPAELPVQAPTKYELVINLKTARALGITMPPSVLAG